MRRGSRGAWACLAALVALALLVKSGLLQPTDEAVAGLIRDVQSPVVTEAARAITFFGSSLWTVTAIGLMALWWRRPFGAAQGAVLSEVEGRRARRPRALLVFLGAGAAGLLLQVGLRYAVAHWRPDAAPPAAADWMMRYELAGFTSGHALRSAYLFGWWADTLRRWGGAWGGIGAMLCVVMVVAVGLTRVYLNRHWLTDVVGAWLIAGWALSIASAARGSAVRHG